MMNHEQELVAIKKLSAAEYNPRTMSDTEMERLKVSLHEFGFLQPIVARRRDGLIIGGHQRLDAFMRLLTEQGKEQDTILDTKVPVIFLDNISDARAKVMNLALNKISGEWDYDKLGELFSSFEADDSASLDWSGFDADEIEDISGMMAEAEKDPPTEDEINDEISARQRRFAFEIDNNEDAALVRLVLTQYGMTGPGNANKAFLAAMKAAETKEEAQ